MSIVDEIDRVIGILDIERRAAIAAVKRLDAAVTSLKGQRERLIREATRTEKPATASRAILTREQFAVEFATRHGGTITATQLASAFRHRGYLTDAQERRRQGAYQVAHNLLEREPGFYKLRPGVYRYVAPSA